MNRWCWIRRYLAGRIPRIRGDEPQGLDVLIVDYMYSPHPRG